MISTRYAKVNNKYMGNKYDVNEVSKYIVYLDKNNLYGTAVINKLPVNGFKWMNNNELLVWRKHPCILEVDLEYPKDLHDLHNDYPLAPERVKCKDNVEKLIPNLSDKKNYVVHHDTLKQYLDLGMKKTCIHRGIKFNESEWLNPYIDLNTKLRTQGKTEFEKDFFKLMNNSVYGKTLEDIRNRVDVKLVSDREKARKLVSKINFKRFNIFSENLVGIHMKKTSLFFNKPIYLGMSILDISKSIMYEFHYNYSKQKYGDKAKLLFTDTDSFMYVIDTDDFYKDITGDVKERFDTSNYPDNHPSGIAVGVNKKVLGMMKDEVGGKIIEEFVGLRSKLYAFKTLENIEVKKCKGIKQAVVNKMLRLENFKQCLFDGTEFMCKMNIIRSYEHKVFTEEVNKVALNPNDDKRYILPDRINTLAWGNYSIGNAF